MTNKLIACLGLAVFALGLGFGMSNSANASDCSLACLGDRTECRHDCAYNPPEYQTYCFNRCAEIYTACMQQCIGG